MYRFIAVLFPAFILLLTAIACDDGPPPSQSEAQPAVVAIDQVGFLAQFQDVVIMQENCDYDRDSQLADCGAHGLYQLQDGIQGEDAVCRVMLVDDQPVGLNCQTLDPPQSIIYAIQSSGTPTPAP